MKALGAGGGARSEDEDVFWRADGSALFVRWTLRPLLDGNEVRGGVLTFADMTRIRAKEEALRRAVRLRDEVVAVVSHDLRNPLGVVGGAAELLLDLPLDEPDRRRQAEIIRRSAARMRRLIEDLLDVARIEADALVVHLAPEDPAVLLAEAHAVFGPQAEVRGVDLEVDSAPGIPFVRVDRDRIHQALANLLDNALKFTPTGGRIVLSARLAEDARVELAVSDTGPGIGPDAAQHVFDRFWQASRHDRTGSGLGLAIVRGIVEAHAGTVEFVSCPGAGATFVLRLPAASDRVERHPA